MANPNPRKEFLIPGQGRPRLDNKTVAMKMSEETKQKLEAIALKYDCIYADKPWIAGLLAKIAEGDLLVVPAPSGNRCSRSRQTES